MIMDMGSQILNLLNGIGGFLKKDLFRRGSDDEMGLNLLLSKNL